MFHVYKLSTLQRMSEQNNLFVLVNSTTTVTLIALRVPDAINANDWYITICSLINSYE